MNQTLKNITEQYLKDFINLVGLVQDELNIELNEILDLEEINNIMPQTLSQLSKDNLIKVVEIYLNNDESFGQGDLFDLINYAKSNANLNEFYLNKEFRFKMLSN